MNEKTVVRGLRFLPKLSLIKCAFEGLCVNDLRGLTFDAEREGDASTGEQARPGMRAHLRHRCFCWWRHSWSA